MMYFILLILITLILSAKRSDTIALAFQRHHDSFETLSRQTYNDCNKVKLTTTSSSSGCMASPEVWVKSNS